MRNKRRSFSPSFKAKVAIEAIKEQSTMQDLACKHQLHAN
jgi:transposase-like protein